MAKVLKVRGGLAGQQIANPFPVTLPVFAGAVGSILPGYLVIVDGSHAGYCKAAADACDTDSTILGVANSTSTDTVAADGTVTIDAAPVMMLEAYVKTAASLTTAMVLTNKYILDVTSGSYTVDQGTTSKGLFKIVQILDSTTGLILCTLATNW